MGAYGRWRPYAWGHTVVDVLMLWEHMVVGVLMLWRCCRATLLARGSAPLVMNRLAL